MRNLVIKSRSSRLTFVTGGLLVAASVVVLGRWAFGDSSTLTLAPATGQRAETAPASSTDAGRSAASSPAAASPREEAVAATASPVPVAEAAAAAPQLVEKAYPWNEATRNVLSAWQQVSQQRT